MPVLHSWEAEMGTRPAHLPAWCLLLGAWGRLPCLCCTPGF